MIPEVGEPAYRQRYRQRATIDHAEIAPAGLCDGCRAAVTIQLLQNLLGIAGLLRQLLVEMRQVFQCLLVRENPALGLELYQAISSQLSATREMLVAVGQRSAEERLAGFLLTLSRRNASRGQDASTIVLPMTRSDIADYLGMTIETVSRMMTKMRKQGLIDIEQCILVTINDAEALADIASGRLR